MYRVVHYGSLLLLLLNDSFGDVVAGVGGSGGFDCGVVVVSCSGVISFDSVGGGFGDGGIVVGGGGDGS